MGMNVIEFRIYICLLVECFFAEIFNYAISCLFLLRLVTEKKGLMNYA